MQSIDNFLLDTGMNPVLTIGNFYAYSTSPRRNQESGLALNHKVKMVPKGLVVMSRYMYLDIFLCYLTNPSGGAPIEIKLQLARGVH